MRSQIVTNLKSMFVSNYSKKLFWPFTVLHRGRIMFKMTYKMVIGPSHLKAMKIKICTIFLPLALCVFKQIVLVILNVLQILDIQPQSFHSSLEQLSNIMFYPLDSWNTKKKQKKKLRCLRWQVFINNNHILA